MLSHAIPSTDCAVRRRLAPMRVLRRARSRAEGLPGGSISFEFHPPLRRQGADLDSGPVPSGAGEGRLRRRLRLSVARRAGARLRRQRADRRDRLAASDDAALFAGPRRLRNGASGHERGLAPRFGGPGLLRGTAQDGAWGSAAEAVFVGQGHKFQIWEPTRFQAHLEQARERVRRLRAERDALAPPGASG